MKPHVYIFRGAPASGKGTVVSEFAKLLPKPVVLIEQDKLRWGFHLIGRSVPEVTQEEHHLANRNTVMLYEQYLKTGKYTVVLEGLFTWDDAASSEGNVQELLNIARRYDYPVTAIVLMADKEELLKRNEARTYSVPHDEFNALYDGVYGKIDPSEVVIDSTHDTSEQTIDKLKELITR